MPYHAHLLGVTSLVLNDGGDEDEAVAAVLHDLIEDTDVTIADVGDRFGERVARIVDACTDAHERPKPEWGERKRAFIERMRTAQPDELRVSLADKLYNVRSIEWDLRLRGDDLWRVFGAGRDGQLWYYRSLADIFLERAPGPMADDLDRVLRRIEDGRRMSLVVIEGHGPVALIRLNRPDKLNALSTALERELDAALDDDRVRAAGAIVVAGNERAFSAGADMSEMQEAGAADALAYYRDTGGVYERIAALPQPTIAAIRGWCLGGGFELALACDFRIADSAATFGLPEVEIGIVPSSGGTVRLVKAIGALRAKELILLRRRLPTAQLAEMGLVTEVVAGDPEPRALAVAAELAALPRLAVELAKKAADAAEDGSRDAGLLIEQLAYAALAEAGGTRPSP